MKKYTLKKEYRDAILQSEKLKGIIAEEVLACSGRTVERYAIRNNPKLAVKGVIDKIREKLKLPASVELIEETKMTDTTTDL